MEVLSITLLRKLSDRVGMERLLRHSPQVEPTEQAGMDEEALESAVEATVRHWFTMEPASADTDPLQWWAESTDPKAHSKMPDAIRFMIP